jgi:dTDP-4-amino-4,6-dideoxygalactose transaminase
MTSKDQNLLAINGGKPEIPEGAPDWPLPDPRVREALDAAWRDGSWGKYHGPHCGALAAALAEMYQSEHVLLCCSGTYAVEAALRGFGIGAGDEVILAGYDFPGNFRAIEMTGATPVLVDIDADNWSLAPASLAAAGGPQVRAVVVSHLHGGLVPMDQVMAWAADNNVAVIEDACQAHGARQAGKLIGTYGDVAVLSFGGSKLLTAGRGGAMLTNRADVFQRAKVFGHRGNDAFPLSELQAAVLLPQLEQIESRNATRRTNVARLLSDLKNLPGLQSLKNRVPDPEPSYYKLAWRYLSEELNNVTREHFTAALRAEGVAINSGFRGFAGRSERRCRHGGDLLNSRRAADTTVVLHHPVLLAPDDQIRKVAAAFAKVVRTFAT